MKSYWILFILILMSNVSYGSFPVITNETVVGSVTAPDRMDTFDIVGWITLSCFVLAAILMALQSILAPGAYFGVYIFLGVIVGGVGMLLGFIWLFSRFKWGRKYWWALLLGLLLLGLLA